MRVALHRISAAAFVAALALVPAGLLALRFAAADWLPADHLWLVDLGATGIAIGLAAQCVVLLWRLGRAAEALHAAVERPVGDGMPSTMQAAGMLPSLVELAAAAGDFEPLRRACREKGDEITFAATLAAERL